MLNIAEICYNADNKNIGCDLLQIIGKIDIEKFRSISENIITDEVVLTDERIQHIREEHEDDYINFKCYFCEMLSNPDIILQDCRNRNTAFIIKKLGNTNLNLILRLVVEGDNPSYKNSIMTFYRVRERNLTKLIQKNKVVYSKE